MTRTVDVKVPAEFWASSILPIGVIEKWMLPEGGLVKAGDPLVNIRIENMVHRLAAPCSGILKIHWKANDVIGPGFVVGAVQQRMGA